MGLPGLRQSSPGPLGSKRVRCLANANLSGRLRNSPGTPPAAAAPQMDCCLFVDLSFVESCQALVMVGLRFVESWRFAAMVGLRLPLLHDFFAARPWDFVCAHALRKSGLAMLLPSERRSIHWTGAARWRRLQLSIANAAASPRLAATSGVRVGTRNCHWMRGLAVCIA